MVVARGWNKTRWGRKDIMFPHRSPRTLFTAAAAGLLLVPLLITGPAAAGTTPPGPPSDRELQKTLDDAVSAGATGIVLRVDDGKGTRNFTAGVAQLDPQVAMRPNPRVRVGSVTKTFLATLIIKAQERGQLRLTDTVEHWLPGLVPHGSRITLRELLNHTSGIFDVVKDDDFFHAVFTDPLQPYTPEQLVNIATAHPRVFKPGKGWGYSNTNYILLGMVLERATHRSVTDLVREQITNPLGLHDTEFPATSPDITGFHAHGYLPPSLTGDGYRDITRISPTALGSAGAIVSTPDDLRAFFRALLSGRVLTPRQLADMKTTVHAGPHYRYGLGLYTRKTPCGRVWGNDGNAPGYETTVLSDASGRRGFVLTVTTQPDDPIGAAETAAIDAATCRILGRGMTSGRSSVTGVH